jgi:hypothetical protein
MATIHLTKGAPKSTRLDEAGVRKRASTKGDVIVEVKPGEEVLSINVGWMVEKFVPLAAQVNGAKKASANGHKPGEPSRKAQSTNGKTKEAKASANGGVTKAAPKTSSSKGKKAAARSTAKKKSAKPAKKSSTKKKK